MRILPSSIENMLYLFRNADSLLPKISFGLAKGVSRVNERGHQTQRGRTVSIPNESVKVMIENYIDAVKGGPQVV